MCVRSFIFIELGDILLGSTVEQDRLSSRELPGRRKCPPPDPSPQAQTHFAALRSSFLFVQTSVVSLPFFAFRAVADHLTAAFLYAH